jgi:23S rRNA (pseudouridine1915-N3)-methyltransferase
MPATVELVGEYVKRSRRFGDVEVVEVRAARGDRPDAVRSAEAERILAALTDDDHVVLCDEKGRMYTTRGLAALLRKRFNAGGSGRLVFVVGGAEGVGGTVRDRADEVLSLSGLTLPHELARVLLAEAVYRALSLIQGHPYHREG